MTPPTKPDSDKSKGEQPQPKRIGNRPLGGVIFVLATLVLWFVFAVLAQAVVIAVPALPGCLQRHAGPRCLIFPETETTGQTGAPQAPASGGREKTTVSDRFVLIISLLSAMWAASRLVFPPENFDPPPETPDKQRKDASVCEPAPMGS